MGTKTHKFALQTKGLTNDEAAALAYVIYHAAWALSHGGMELGTDIAVGVLNGRFPDVGWTRYSAEARRELVE